MKAHSIRRSVHLAAPLVAVAGAIGVWVAAGGAQQDNGRGPGALTDRANYMVDEVIVACQPNATAADKADARARAQRFSALTAQRVGLIRCRNPSISHSSRSPPSRRVEGDRLSVGRERELGDAPVHVGADRHSFSPGRRDGPQAALRAEHETGLERHVLPEQSPAEHAQGTSGQESHQEEGHQQVARPALPDPDRPPVRIRTAQTASCGSCSAGTVRQSSSRARAPRR